jgi:Invasion associated locus B (IalB) protein
MTRAPLSLLLPLLLLALPASAAHKAPPPHPRETAPHPKHLGGAGRWQAYAFGTKAAPVCYLYGDPVKTGPKNFRRKAPVAMVTHRPEEHVFNVVSFTEFTPLKVGSAVSLDVDATKFDLFTHGDTAWSPTAETDKTIVETMSKGREAIVKTTPKTGPQITDTYSLVGFTKALLLIDKACGVKR